MQNRVTKPYGTSKYHIWARRLLRCYPRAWRDRYEHEMEQLLLGYTVTFWTLIDLLLGALDARLHPDLLPGRITSMASRIRTSEVAIFCAFIVYGVAWLAVRFVRDPLPTWDSAVQRHPEISAALIAVDSAGVIALLALLIGGVPILYIVLRNAFRDRRWKLLGLLAVPLLAIAVLVIYSLLAVEASTQRTAPGTPDAPFTTLALVLQLGLILLLLAAVVGSTTAVAIAVKRSQFSDRLLRFALIPAGIVTLGMVAGLVATIILSVLILTEAPELQGTPGNLEIVMLFMAIAAVVAITALWRGIRTPREQTA